MIGQSHIPVLLDEALGYLNAKRGGVYIDCTLGLAGHAHKLLESNPQAQLIGFDRDESSLAAAQEKLRPFSNRIQLYHADFRVLPDLDIEFSQVRGVLVDLGISSFQLDDAQRGFSFHKDGPLDMRLDLRSRTTAARILEKYSEPKLAQIFHDFGELRQAKKLASAIVSRRKMKKIDSTIQLFQIVEQVCHWRPQKGKSHPAARVFQALRIEVNQELHELGTFLQRTTSLLAPETRWVVISFHSLEDRIVKHTLAGMATDQDTSPLIKILTKKPVPPSPEEIEKNFRSRSAKLRAAERL